MIDEAVAQSDHGLNLTSCIAEFRPQSTDVHVHGTGLDACVVAPDFFEETVSRDQTVPVGDQVSEKRKFPSGESNTPAIRHYRHRLEVGEQTGAAIHGRVAGGVTDSPPQNGPYPSSQLAHAE